MGFNQDIALKEIQFYQEYQIALSSAGASTAQLLAFINNATNGLPDQTQIVVLEARGDTIIFNFGGPTVVANKTITSNALPTGNISLPQGAIVTLAINGQSQNYVSCQATSGGSAATFAVIRLGKYAL